MKDFIQAYAALAHAIQTVIAYELGLGGEKLAGATPKHLRVGIDLERIDQGSLVKLLIAKGVFTEDEVHEAILNGLRAELDTYERKYPGIKFH